MSASSERISGLHLAYLTSRYPGTSHTFIGREVAAVRALGVRVDNFSIRLPYAAELEDEAIRAEANSTYTVLARPIAELFAAHLQLLFTRPIAYFRTFLRALEHRPPGLKGLALSFAHFAESVLLARELKRRDVTHLHNHFANSAATVGFLAAGLLSLPWSFTMHGISETDYPAGLMLAGKIDAARFVTCVSYFGRAQAMRITRVGQWTKMHIVRCGLPFDRLPARGTSNGEEVRLVCVGRLSPEKGQAGLLQAFASVAADLPHLRLTLVGDGPDGDALQSLASQLGLDQQVTFTGRLAETEALREIARSDILVLPSFMEGLPVVLMEAMAVGTAVIATRVAGIPELVRDGEAGLLFTPSDWTDLGQCIRTLAGNPDLRDRLAANGRKRVSSEFDIRLSAERLIELFCMS